MKSESDLWKRDGKHSNFWPQWGCFDIRWRQRQTDRTRISPQCNAKQCKAMKTQTSYNQTYFDLNAYTIPGGCCGSTSKKTVVGGWAWAWWLVTDVQRWAPSDQTISYSCWIHYDDINEIKIEIWISNQTFCWIPLEITKIHFLSLKLSALLLSEADGGGHYLLLSHNTMTALSQYLQIIPRGDDTQSYLWKCRNSPGRAPHSHGSGPGQAKCSFLIIV